MSSVAVSEHGVTSVVVVGRRKRKQRIETDRFPEANHPGVLRWRSALGRWPFHPGGGGSPKRSGTIRTGARSIVATHRRQVEVPLAGGAHDAGQDLLGVGAVAGAVAAAHLADDDGGPDGLFGAPVGGVERGVPQEEEHGREFGGQVRREALGHQLLRLAGGPEPYGVGRGRGASPGRIRASATARSAGRSGRCGGWPDVNSLWQKSAILARPDRSSFVHLTPCRKSSRSAPAPARACCGRGPHGQLGGGSGNRSAGAERARLGKPDGPSASPRPGIREGARRSPRSLEVCASPAGRRGLRRRGAFGWSPSEAGYDSEGLRRATTVART